MTSMPWRLEWMPVEKIRVGKRHRKDMGDIAGLAGAMADIDLPAPIVVRRRDGLLVCGERRLRAEKLRGKTHLLAFVGDFTDAEMVRAEFSENINRKDFTWTEAVAIKRALEPLEKAAAKERQREGGRRGGKGSGKLPEASKCNAADKAAKAAGKKRRSLEKAEAVVEAAEADPQRYGDLVPRLDEDGARVEVIHREMTQRQKRAAYEATITEGGTVADLHALAASAFRAGVIYIDPAWTFKVYSGKGKQRSAERHYDTMSLDAIKALPVAALAADDCALFLCAVSPELPGALDVIKHWGFEYSTVGFYWVKTNPSSGTPEVGELKPEDLHWGMGYSTRANVEMVLLAKRGSPKRLAKDVHQVVIAPVGEHSEKPEEVARRVERLYPGPHLELFARRPREGWTTWGNEIARGDEAPLDRSAA